MLMALAWLMLAWASDSFQITGRVLTETQTPVEGARILLKCGASTAQALSDPGGVFRLDLASSEACQLRVERDGYFPLAGQTIEPSRDGTDVRLLLTPLREVVSETEVRADREALDLDTSSTQQTTTGTEMLNVPFPITNNLKNALQITPGVVLGNDGDLHINGGGSAQTLYTLNGFNVSDPLTGTFQTRLSLEAVQAVDVAGGALPAEFGKGSAGTMTVRTRSGDDRFRASATNFIPGVEYRKGLVIGNFTPRLNLSGPILRGRAWFSDSLDFQYDQNVVTELPKGEDRTHSFRASNYLNTQINLTPSNILQAGFLATFFTAPRFGLTALDPEETTVDRRARQWFAHIKDQIYFSRGALLEIGYAANRTFGREIPQGREWFQITPWGKRGNWFRDALQEGGRDQIIANAFLPSFEWKGSHQFKVGLDLNSVRYSQDISRTGLVQYRADGSVMRMVRYEGSGILTRTNFEAASYVQDQWKVKPGLMLNLGLRWDWDHAVRRSSFAPRAGFAWSPSGHENTKLSAGAGYVYDASNLMLLTRPNDQHLTTSYFAPTGEPIEIGAPSYFLPASRRLRPTGFFNFNAGIEHRFANSFYVKVGYLGKRGLQGLTFWNSPEPRASRQTSYRLANLKQDRYDSLEFTVRKTFSAQYEILASYIRSSARSNAATDITVDEPFIVTANSGPMAWDTPNRFLTWGYVPTPWKKWAVAYLTEWRTGFPYSVIAEDGRIVGGVNSQRFPTYFQMNLHVEWKVRMWRNYWALRGGCNNLTGRRNPIVVNNLVGTHDFLNYYGGFGRSFTVRVRWLGREKP